MRNIFIGDSFICTLLGALLFIIGLPMLAHSAQPETPTGYRVKKLAD